MNEFERKFDGENLFKILKVCEKVDIDTISEIGDLLSVYSIKEIIMIKDLAEHYREFGTEKKFKPKVKIYSSTPRYTHIDDDNAF